MKKLFILTAMLCFCGLAIAQHLDYVDQWGNLNNSTVTQSTDDPTALYGNAAYVSQYGDMNLSEVTQYNEAIWEDGNLAEVEQYGNENEAYIDQQVAGNEAEIEQWGDLNVATTTQIGEWNISRTLQEGYYNYSVVNIFGFRNETFAWQTGWANYAVQTMGDAIGVASVADSYFKTDQWGDYNTSEQLAIGLGDLFMCFNFDNWGEIYQYGDFNYAGNLIDGSWNDSFQYQLFDFNYSIHYQVGDGNVSVTYQNW